MPGKSELVLPGWNWHEGIVNEYLSLLLFIDNEFLASLKIIFVCAQDYLDFCIDFPFIKKKASILL